MTALGPAIDRAVAREDVDPPSIDGLERIRVVLTFAGKKLAGADPQLIQPGSLDGMANALQNTLSEIDAFVTDGNAGHVINANSHVEGRIGDALGGG